MSVASIFKKEHKVNFLFFILSYLSTVFFLSVVIVGVVTFINYTKHNFLMFDMMFALKTVKMLSIGGFFAFIWSAFCISNDKKKCINMASNLIKQYNNYRPGLEPENKEKMGQLKEVLEEIDMNRNLYGLMSDLIVNDFDTRVRGINVKEVNYYLSCEMKYRTGEKDNFEIKFSAINGGDPVLKYISCLNQ